MRANRYLGWVMGLMLCGAARASSDAGTLPSASDAGTPISAEVLARCAADFERVVREEWSSHVTRKQTRALLSGLSSSCVEVLPATLREGAAEAAALRGVDRARRLIEAARSFVPEGCLAAPDVSASVLASRCPPPRELLGAELPGDLDTGTYVFVLAVRSQLLAHGAYGERAQRWASEFLLRSMIENEDRRKQGAH